MHKNIHPIDRLFRLIIAEGIVFIGFFWAPPVLQTVLYMIAGGLALTSATGLSYCYDLAGVNTAEKFREKTHPMVRGLLIYAAVLLPIILLYKKGQLGALHEEFFLAIMAGFIAQMIDGSLGMAYGISSNTFLLSMGFPPAAASASVHAAEIVTSGLGGLAHWRAGNVDMKTLKYLAASGVIGAIGGAYLLTNISGEIIRPFIAIYLLVMGFLIIEKAFQQKPLAIRAFLKLKEVLRMEHGEHWGKRLVPFGILGGFLDSIGGGGWGPIITLTLFFQGENLRRAIGSVNLSEFFVTLVASIAFLSTLKLAYWQTIAGLMVGGVLAVPMGPWITKRIPYQPLMLMVGVVVTALSLRTLYLFFLARL